MSDDIVDVLRSMAAAYPEDIFPVPPPEKQARDAAAAHVLRTVAVPHFARAADEIERLREALRSAALGLECCSIGGFESDPDHVIGVYDDIRAALDNDKGAQP